jgi:hypothetical protein
MLDLTGFPALDLAIGLSFVFFLLAILASTLQEFIAAIFGLRARTLEQGLRSLLEDPKRGWQYVSEFYDHELIRSLYRTRMPPGVTGRSAGDPRDPKVRRKLASDALAQAEQDVKDAQTVDTKAAAEAARDEKLAAVARGGHRTGFARVAGPITRTKGPSYISPRTFAEVVLDIFLPNKQRAIKNQVDLDAFLKSLPPALQDRLRPLATTAVTDVSRFRKHIEAWYDDTMARVSGWYKRKTQIILLAIGIVLVPLLNANALVIGERLWKDTELRAAVVAQATAAVATPSPTATPTPTPTASPTGSATPSPTPSPIEVASGKLDDAATSVNNAVKLGVPMGWSNDLAKPHWDSFSGWMTALGGWLLTIAAISLGAPFWFDLLGRFSRLRSSGKPETPLPATGRGLENERVREPQ